MDKRDIALAGFLGTAAFISAMMHPMSDMVYVGIKLGEHIIRHHALAPPDYLNWLPVNTGWWDTSWLWNALSCSLYGSGGIGALKIMAGLPAALLAVLIYLACRPVFDRPGTTILSLILLIVLNNSLAFNPLLGGLVFFMAQILLLERRGRIALPLFFIFLFWSQTDRSFAAGLIYLFFYLAACRDMPLKKKAIFALAAIMGSLPSPSMWRFVSRPINLAILLEQSPNFHLTIWRLHALAVLSGLSGAAIDKKRPGSAAGLIALTAAGLASQEFMPMAVLAAAPIMAVGVKRLSEQIRLFLPRFVMVTSAILLTVVLITTSRLSSSDQVETEELAIFLKEHRMLGNILAPSRMGGRVALATGKKVAMDGRSNLFPKSATEQFSQLYGVGKTGWNNLARKYNLGGVIIKSTEPTYGIFSTGTDWALAFEGKNYAFFVLDWGLNSSYLDRWGRLKPRKELYGKSLEEIVRHLRDNAEEGSLKGNPYRVRSAWMALLSINPDDAEAQSGLDEAQHVIDRMERDR